MLPRPAQDAQVERGQQVSSDRREVPRVHRRPLVRVLLTAALTLALTLDTAGSTGAPAAGAMTGAMTGAITGAAAGELGPRSGGSGTESGTGSPLPVRAAGRAGDPTLGTGRYIVVLDQEPAASYRGGVQGFARTAARRPAAFRAGSTAVSAYADHQRLRQGRIADFVGAQPYYHYTVALNGFAAQLTGRQARLLDREPSVRTVVPDTLRTTDAGQPPRSLGETGTGSGWSGWGKAVDTDDRAGRGVVIGVVDSGIDSGNPSFAADGGRAPTTWDGSCDPGTDTDTDAAYACSDKLVGGRYYVAGQGGSDAVWDREFLSPEDRDGHGSRVASIAAGRAGVQARPDGIDLGTVSGVAPAARLASYKACWADEIRETTCATSDVLAAVDQAVRDGVDVLAHAVAGSRDLTDPVQIAFMHAADAGVFVATSAGNDGPAAGTVAHPGPWVTTVAAATRRGARSRLVLGDGQRFVGASLDPDGVPESPLVLGWRAVDAGVPPGDARRCLPGSLDPTAVRGAVVVCDRGVNARVDKSQVVEAAGGVGMVLVNRTTDDVVADIHAVPTVHLEEDALDEVNAYASSDSATARVVNGVRRSASDRAAPAPANLSGRGPVAAADGDLLKPDIAAPGVDVLAAAAPEGHRGREHDLGTGTSAAAPYVAGLAAVVLQRHRDWSPMAVKSALMTSARFGAGTGDPLAQGAGHVAAGRALDPGLVLDSGYRQWSALLAGGAGRERHATSDVNVASVSVDELAGREVVSRRFTNVGRRTATYRPSFDGLPGFAVGFFPATLTLDPGQSRVVQLTFDRVSADFGEWAAGSVTFSDRRGGHRVRLPVALRPVGVSAPAEVRLDRGGAVTTRSGVSGGVRARLRGLVSGDDTAGTGEDTGGVDFRPDLPGNYSQTLTVGSRRELVRVETLPGDPADDLDLHLVDRDGTVVASAATGSGAEQLTVDGLEAGTYTIYVQPWFVADPQGTASFTVRTFSVPPRTSAGDTVSVLPGEQLGRRLRWRVESTGVEGGRPSLGWIGWYEVGEPGNLLGRTVVGTG